MVTDPDLQARETLRLIGPDPQNWVLDRAGVDHNLVIVGGGQSGSTFAFALRRAGIDRVSVIDAAQDEASAGVWLTRAHMSSSPRAFDMVIESLSNTFDPTLGILGVRARTVAHWLGRRGYEIAILLHDFAETKLEAVA